MAIICDERVIAISGAELELFRQQLYNKLQDKRIPFNGVQDVLVTTALNELLELASGKANIVVANELPTPTQPNSQYWVLTYNGQTAQSGRYIIITDRLNNATFIGTSDADMANYYTKVQTDALLDEKQELLQSGVNIKTINGIPILGAGNMVVGGGSTIQVTSLPTADAGNLGRVLQYIGTNNPALKYGSFYACVAIKSNLYGWTHVDLGTIGWTTSPTPKCGEDYPAPPGGGLNSGDPIYGSQVAGKYHIATYIGPTAAYLDLPNRIRNSLASWYTRNSSADVVDATLGYEWVRVLYKTSDFVNDGNGTSPFITEDDVAGKQDKLVDKGTYYDPTDSDTLSGLFMQDGKLSFKGLTLNALMTWIKRQCLSVINSASASLEMEVPNNKAVVDYAVKKLATANDNIYGHNGATEKEFAVDKNLSSSSTNNQIPTSKAVYDKALKETQAVGGSAVTTTGMNSNLTRTSASHQGTTTRITKKNGYVHLQYFGQYSCGSTGISNIFTCVGSVPDAYKPIAQTAINLSNWNFTPNAPCGYIDTSGRIYVWVTAIGANQTNIQICLNATWKAAS